jgi:hypothetical protein
VDTLSRRVAAARDGARAETYHRLAALLAPPRPSSLDGLLHVDDELGMTRLAWLHRGATAATPEVLKAELAKLEFLRAHGADRLDARLEHPTTELPVTKVGAAAGDVLARYTMRRDEFAASTELACHLIESHIGPTTLAETLPLRRGARSDCSGIGIVEGWRGTIVHRVEVDDADRIARAKIVDPSWFNWPALPVAMADTIVPDFPLANKSFNQSYAGNDLYPSPASANRPSAV